MKDPEDVLKENPGSVIFARYAEELAQNGKIDEAIEVLSNGINANPDYAAGYSVLAEINANQKLHEAAIEHLEKSLSLEPQAPRDIFNLGKYSIDNQADKAKDYLTYGEIDKEILVAMLKKRLKLKGNDKLDEKKLKEITKFDSFEKFADDLFAGKVKLKDFAQLKPVFRLTPPSKGLKSVNEHYPKGDLGYRGKEINELLKRMI